MKFSRGNFGVISFRYRGEVLTWYYTAGFVGFPSDEKVPMRADVDRLMAYVYIAVHLMGTDQEAEAEQGAASSAPSFGGTEGCGLEKPRAYRS